jgi:hypothetical protein
VVEHGGNVPYAHRASEQDYIEHTGDALSERDVTAFDAQYLDADAANYRKSIKPVERGEPDPAEELEELDRQRERKIRDRAIIGFHLFSRIPMIIHMAARTYNPSKRTTLETWVRICAGSEARSYLGQKTGKGGTTDGRKRDKTQALPVDIYAQSGVAHIFRDADRDIRACLSKGRSHKIRRKADGEKKVLAEWWKGLKSDYVLSALGRLPKQRTDDGRDNGPNTKDVAGVLGFMPNTVSRHVAHLRGTIDSLRIAEDIEFARLSYCKDLGNKKKEAHFFELIRNSSRGASPPAVDAGLSQREQAARYQNQGRFNVGIGAPSKENFEIKRKVRLKHGKKQTIDCVRDASEISAAGTRKTTFQSVPKNDDSNSPKWAFTRKWECADGSTLWMSGSVGSPEDEWGHYTTARAAGDPRFAPGGPWALEHYGAQLPPVAPVSPSQPRLYWERGHNAQHSEQGLTLRANIFEQYEKYSSEERERLILCLICAGWSNVDCRMHWQILCALFDRYEKHRRLMVRGLCR